MSKVKYIIEVDKDDIDVFLNHMNEHYIIHQYDGEIAVCGRVLLSTFKTATPLTESNDAVSRAEVCSIANGLKDYCVSMYNPNDASEAEIINYIYKYVDTLYDLPSVTPKRERGEWILVRERLPKVDGLYRVIQKSGGYATYVFHKDGNSEEYWKRCAVAWMPLSESHKTESENKE